MLIASSFFNVVLAFMLASASQCEGEILLSFGCRAEDLLVAEATHQMIIHQSGGLHQCVTNGGPNESKAALLQILT
jgi:hypothetical protein